MLLVMSGAATYFTWTDYHPRLTIILENPWLVLTSYIVQPAFCVEFYRMMSQSRFDLLRISVLILNACVWLHVVYSQLMADEDTWNFITLKNLVLGVFVNFYINWIVALFWSA